MPTTFGSQIRTVADIVKTVTNCSSAQANEAEQGLCSSPENLRNLAIACGFATSTVGAGGVLLWTAPGTAGASAIPGLALIAGGSVAAKKICSAFVKYSTPEK